MLASLNLVSNVLFFQTLVKTFEVCDLPVRASKFVARKNWVITGAVSYIHLFVSSQLLTEVNYSTNSFANQQYKDSMSLNLFDLVWFKSCVGMCSKILV